MNGDHSSIPFSQGFAFRSPHDAIGFFTSLLRDEQVERVLTAYLDADFEVLAVRLVAGGDASAASLPLASMLRAALRDAATRIIVAHNHPSGDPMPSAQDKAATRRLATAATALDIDLVDHIVIARGGAFSFRLHGLL